MSPLFGAGAGPWLERWRGARLGRAEAKQRRREAETPPPVIPKVPTPAVGPFQPARMLGLPPVPHDSAWYLARAEAKRQRRRDRNVRVHQGRSTGVGGPGPAA